MISCLSSEEARLGQETLKPVSFERAVLGKLFSMEGILKVQMPSRRLGLGRKREARLLEREEPEA